MLLSHVVSFRSSVIVVVIVVVIGIVWAQVSSPYEREVEPLRILPSRPPWSDEGSDAILLNTVLIIPLASSTYP